MLATVGLNENNIQLSSGQGNNWVKNANIHALSAWEPDPQGAIGLLGSDAIEFRNRDAYREIVNLNTTAENLADPKKRAAIVGLVRTLIAAADQVTRTPETVWPIMEKVMGFKQKVIADSWFIQEYKGTLAADLLDVMEKEEVWLANQQNRKPRTRQELAPLIDTSILEEALQVR
jgi:NitT/TauT family transport system substrate-binding protein